MKTRLTISTLLAILFGFSLAWVVSASGPPEGEDGAKTWLQAQLEALAAGEPQLNYRYVKTFGVTEQPYISATTRLNAPGGLFIDSGDKLYVAEKHGQRLLIFNSGGAFERSIGQAGNEGASEDGASFEDPKDVVQDPAGNIWLADADRVIQFDAAGSFLQMFPATDPWQAGSGNDRFDGPRGVAFDSAGKMYVADSDNHRIQVFTFEGNGKPVYSATIGQTRVVGSDNNHFDGPSQLAIDSQDRLYVADRWNTRIQRCTYSSSWSCATFHGGSWGSGPNELEAPIGVSVDSSDNIYIADTENGRVKKCTSAGVCDSSFITGLNRPYDVAFDSSGNVYVSDFADFTIRKFSSSGTALGIYLGVSGVPYQTDNNHFNRPQGIEVDGSGNLYLTTDRGFRAMKLDASGSLQWSAGIPGVWGDDNAHFGDSDNGPHDIAVDPSGKIYVVDTGNGRIQIFNSSGSYQATLGTGWGQGNYEFADPEDIAFDAGGNLYVADQENHRVQIFDSSLNYVATLGQTGVSGSDYNHFDHPTGVFVDKNGHIYVADSENYRVQVFNQSRNHVLTLGQTGVSGSDNSHFDSPHDVTVDAIGRIYVVDAYNDRVQVFDGSGGYLTTIGGSWGASPGQLRSPQGVAVDEQGIVYVADSDNHRVQKFAPGIPGWIQVNEGGFGNPDSGGITALEPFNGQLYAAASNWEEGVKIWRASSPWSSVTTAGFGTSDNSGIFDLHEFGGRLYAGVWNDNQGGEIWRSDTTGENWTQVMAGGFGKATNVGIYPFATFSGALYVATDSYTDTHGTEIWCSLSGNAGSWSQVANSGFGSPKSGYLSELIEFDGALYAAVNNEATGLEIWRTTTATTCGSGWEAVVASSVDGDGSGSDESGFGNPDNTEFGSLTVFDNQLYAAIENETTGGQIWRTGDGLTWSQVVGNGFGDANNEKVEALKVFGGQLYAVTENKATGAEVWRSANGTSWNDQVNIDGWGDSSNESTFWSQASTVYNNGLYIGTWNWGSGGEIWYKAGEFTAVDSSVGDASSFAHSDGLTTTVDIPAGALTENILYVFTPQDSPEYPTSEDSFAGRAFAINVYKDGQALLSYNFVHAVTLVVRYTDADVSGTQEEEIMLRYWNGSAWSTNGITRVSHDLATNTITFQITHLTEFALLGPASSNTNTYIPIIVK